MPRSSVTRCVAAIGLWLLAGCAGMDARLETATRAAGGVGLVRRDVSGGAFILATWARITDGRAPLTVYIEGDGLAWMTTSQVSPDPTPTDPLGLRLAALDPAANVLYVARPCQFQTPAGSIACGPVYWTTRIYAPEVIDAIDQVITAFAGRTSGVVRLVGYSGGGAVAVLVSARRSDVSDLRTVAGNLSTRRFTAYHRVSSYGGSLDPADAGQSLRALPQIHFIGADDRVVPALIAEDYMAHMGPSHCARTVTVAAAHAAGWAEAWPELLSQRPGCGR